MTVVAHEVLDVSHLMVNGRQRFQIFHGAHLDSAIDDILLLIIRFGMSRDYRSFIFFRKLYPYIFEEKNSFLIETKNNVSFSTEIVWSSP